MQVKDVTKTCMLIAHTQKELPSSEERKRIMDRAIQTLKHAQTLLERLDELEQCTAIHAKTHFRFPTLQVQNLWRAE